MIYINGIKATKKDKRRLFKDIDKKQVYVTAKLVGKDTFYEVF